MARSEARESQFLAVGLLVVQREVLGRGGHAVALHAAHQRSGQVAGQQRILGVVLKVPAAQRVAVDVDGRGQPHADVVLLDLLAGGAAHGLGDLRVPGAGQQAGAGEGRGHHAHLGLDAQARGAVGGHGVGHAEGGQVAVAEGVGHAGVGLAAQQPGQVLVGQLGDEVVQRAFALGDLDQLAAGVFVREAAVGHGRAPRGRALHLPSSGMRSSTLASGSLGFPGAAAHSCRPPACASQLGRRHAGGELLSRSGPPPGS